MRPKLHFLFICIGALQFGCLNEFVSSQCLPKHPNGTECTDKNSTSIEPNTAGMCNNDGCFPSTTPTASGFLQCAGVPVTMTENSMDHMQTLREVIDTVLDIYAFMRSTVDEGLILDLQEGIAARPEAEQFHDLDFVKLWFQVKLKPLLSTVTQNFLSCLSTRNFSCETYQAVVEELSLLFSDMDPVRQRWIYMFFMYPFLARNGTAGCVVPLQTSEDWLMKNFGSFSAMAHFKDFTSLNMVFSGLDVLDLLTPEQKAEIILHPEVSGLDNGSINLVFESLSKPSKPLQGNQFMNVTRPTYSLNTSAPILEEAAFQQDHQDSIQTALSTGFLVFLKPLGGFVQQFVSLTRQQDLATLKSTTLAQAMINWTLAELAGQFNQNINQNITAADEIYPLQASSFDSFEFTDVDDWFEQIVVPALKHFLPENEMQIPEELASVFYNLYFMDSNLNVSDAPDKCSVTIEEPSCSIPNAVENLANVLRCFSHVNLPRTEEDMEELITELSQILDSMFLQYSTTNSSSAESDFLDLFGQLQTDSLTSENLHDAEYIGLWFQIKLRPLLPSVSEDFLLCLSNKNFSCETFQVIVMGMNNHISLMDEIQQEIIFSHFIHPFLMRHKYTDFSCDSSKNSLDWVEENIGKFARFAPLQLFFDLKSNFSALEALPALSGEQMAELVVSPVFSPHPEDVTINTVFDHLLESPQERNLKEFLHQLILLSTEGLVSCDSLNLIFGRLELALPSVPQVLQLIIQDSMNELLRSAPEDCILGSFECKTTPYDETRVCATINSTELQRHLDSGNMTDMLCHFSIGQYACSSLTEFTAENLVTLLKCTLHRNMTCSKETWKVFLSKTSGVLDEALSIFSNMSSHITSFSASHFLDILGELRIDDLDDEQLADFNFINKWFHGNLYPFLSSVSGEFLRCLATKNFSCETYQEVVKAFSCHFPQMNQMRHELVARYFILPSLSQNTSDPSCISNTNGSLDWLQKNFGAFSVLLPLADLQKFNADFDPLAALPVLSAEQMAELVASPESVPHPEDLIINRVFDLMLESPQQLNLQKFLYHLMSFSAEKSFSCNASNIIYRRLDLALPSTPSEFEPVIRDSMNTLLQRAPGCISGDFGCQMTLYNKTRVCATVNSAELELYPSSANMTNTLCHFSIGQHACSSKMEFTAENLVTLLQCKLPSNMKCSKETWKMFLTNVSGILDEALHIFSNMSSHFTSLAASHFLDILGELRIDEFSDEQLADVDFINMWFHGNLRPFLSSVTGEFMQCLGTKNFSCETYQAVLKAFDFQFTQMDRMQSELVYKDFILPNLFKNTSDPACVSSSNGSLDWLHKNFGGFSVLASLRTLQMMNPYFSPLETLPVLSAEQMAELVVFPQTEPPEKQVIINAVFDRLQESPYAFKEFLHFLIMFSRETMIECDEYETIFLRLYQALPSVPQDLEPDVWASINELMKTAPGDHCLPDVPGCSFIPHNETRVCAGINSSELQHYLNIGIESEELCHFDIEQYACSSLINFTAERLVSLLKCKLPNSTSCSIETWKVFLTKVSGVLNGALNIFSNMSFHITSPSTSHFLEVLGEIRIDRFSDVQVADVDFVSKWFQGYLRPFLSSVSGEFLHCLTTKNFSCETYQQVMKEFSFQFHRMDPMNQELVSKYFIVPFLSRNTSDPACVSSTNGTTDWVHKNFGPFLILVPIRTLWEISQDFDPLEVLPFLSAKQMAEVVMFLEAASSQHEVIINTVFDRLLESQDMAAFKEFLHYLNQFSSEVMISCNSYKTIWSRLYLALPTTPEEIEPNIWASINELMKTAPGDCMPDVTGCSLTQHNETRLCSDVNSSELQQYLNFGNITEKLCHFDIEQYACSSLIHFTAEDLVNLLKCKLIGNMTYSKETWKLFLIKTIGVLNEALSILSNMSYHFTSPCTTHFLEILGEIRIDKFSDVQLADVDFVSKWFHGYLSPFLSSVSEEFLRCLNTKNLSCETYQQVVMGFSLQFSNMTQSDLVFENFIHPFLTRNTSDPACVSGTNGSADWLRKNLGAFSVPLPLETLQMLNQDFDPMEALPLLSAKQAAELVLFYQSGPPQKVIIDKVFEHLLESPEKKNLHEFLKYLVMLSPMANISCDSYNEIFDQLNQALSVVPTEVVLTITTCIEKLMSIAPQDCTTVVFSEECDVTSVNETALCAGVNSSDLQRRIMDGSITEMLCSFSIEQYACVLPIGLTAQHLATLLQCKLNSSVTISKETWKLFLSKVSRILDEALNLFSGMMESSHTQSASHVLDVIGEIRFGGFTEELRDIHFVKEWFHMKLKPFIPSVSKEFLSCLSKKNFSCPTYQAVVKIFCHNCAKMDEHQKISVFTDFIDVFLSKNDTTDPGCISSTNGSADWLNKNFGSFSKFASLKDFRRLNMYFIPMDALSHLSLGQLSDVASTPGQLKNSRDVNRLMDNVKAKEFATFFDVVSPAIQEHQSLFPSSVRSAMLEHVFDRGNLSQSSVSDADILNWLHNRLRPLLPDLSMKHVAPFFKIVQDRQCNTSQQAVQLLNSIHSTLPSDTQKEVHSHILASLKEPVPLQCYTDGNFYVFLKRSFLSFQFPNLAAFVSLMPESRRPELINSIPPSDLGDFLKQPNVVDNSEELCVLFHNNDNAPDFLETQEDIPVDVRREILPCVWPFALTSENETEVDIWFERRLKNYLTFLTRDLINSRETLNAACPAFRKIVQTLGDSNIYENADFSREDVYVVIKSYLSTGTKPKCYNATQPHLNSKAWLSNYIDEFVTYLTLDDLNTFGSTTQLQVLSTNLDSLALFNHSSVPVNVSSYFTELIYSENSNFNPLLLPMNFRCYAPGSAYSQLTPDQSKIILHNLTQTCSELDPEVSAALAGNFKTVNKEAIDTLGNESVGLSPVQISSASPSDIVSSLPTLSSVTGWNLGQSSMIVNMLLKASFAIVKAMQLVQLGSLVAGVASSSITSIDSTEILVSSQNPSFIPHILASPRIIRQTYVRKIVSINSVPETLLDNVPDSMATEIPRTRLQFSAASFEKINRKRWRRKQAVLFYNVVADGFSDPNSISSSVLQGFTCTRVQRYTRFKIRNLIRASRRRGVNRVVLRESQLTCMYNYMRGYDTDSFRQYPRDMLLYYNYEYVRHQCVPYFTEIGEADFSVLSNALRRKKETLLRNAKDCLGINGTNINRTNVEILGNMCCVLEGSYIENSDPLIVEKLKNCKDLSEEQSAAVQKVLMAGSPGYGHPSTWNLRTLKTLGILPLYLKVDFWRQFSRIVKRRFLKIFLRARRRDRTPRRKLRDMFRECIRSLRFRRAAASDCTAGDITNIAISDDSFPFGYDSSQFESCLSIEVVKNNLAAIAIKVDDDEFQRIVLDKLNQAYPAGIPDEQVRLLQSISRVATIDEINIKWNITKIDTLDALMDPDDGPWPADKSKAIILKYLSSSGSSLGLAELNVIGGENLCSLDTSVLQEITPSDLRNANDLVPSNCSIEKKRVLFEIASNTSSNQRNISTNEFQIVEEFLGGAKEEYIRSLTTSNVSMNIFTFMDLDPDVLEVLPVKEVELLLGPNVGDLKTYEHETAIQEWIRNRLQSQLDLLQLSLNGGKEDPVTTVSSPATTAAGGPRTTATTTSGSAGLRTKSSQVLPLLFVLMFTILSVPFYYDF